MNIYCCFIIILLTFSCGPSRIGMPEVNSGIHRMGENAECMSRNLEKWPVNVMVKFTGDQNMCLYMEELIAKTTEETQKDRLSALFETLASNSYKEDFGLDVEYTLVKLYENHTFRESVDKLLENNERYLKLNLEKINEKLTSPLHAFGYINKNITSYSKNNYNPILPAVFLNNVLSECFKVNCSIKAIQFALELTYFNGSGISRHPMILKFNPLDSGRGSIWQAALRVHRIKNVTEKFRLEIAKNYWFYMNNNYIQVVINNALLMETLFLYLTEMPEKIPSNIEEICVSDSGFLNINQCFSAVKDIPRSF